MAQSSLFLCVPRQRPASCTFSLSPCAPAINAKRYVFVTRILLLRTALWITPNLSPRESESATKFRHPPSLRARSPLSDCPSSFSFMRLLVTMPACFIKPPFEVKTMLWSYIDYNYPSDPFQRESVSLVPYACVSRE